jgi:V/A-type H+-transporting ATPase subunit F
MDDENKIAVIGDYDSIYGFASLGLSTFPVEGQEDAVRTLKNLASSGYGIIYITEELAALTEKQIEKYKEVMTPAIIQIPGVKGNTGDGIRAVRRSVEQAVGSDILFGE